MALEEQAGFTLETLRSTRLKQAVDTSEDGWVYDSKRSQSPF